MDHFEEIVEQYEPMIYKVMNSLNIYTNRDEFYQIGLIALWDAYERFDHSKGNFLNFAFTYVKGRMMTELSRQSRHQERSVYPEEQFWEFVQDATTTKPLELETLLSYCDGLSERERMWVVYTFYYGLKPSQIAPLEGVTTHAVQQWRRSALKKLRQRFS